MTSVTSVTFLLFHIILLLYYIQHYHNTKKRNGNSLHLVSKIVSQITDTFHESLIFCRASIVHLIDWSQLSQTFSLLITKDAPSQTAGGNFGEVLVLGVPQSHKG